MSRNRLCVLVCAMGMCGGFSYAFGDGARGAEGAPQPVGVDGQAVVGGLGGGGPIGSAVCQTDAERAWIAAAVAEYRAAHGEGAEGGVASIPPLYVFYPLACTLDHDVFIQNFNDVQPGAGLLDYECTGNTYDGHNGSDAVIRSFVETSIGVPVFAVADGRVIYTHDGEPDMNTQPLGQVGNVVELDNGNGRTTAYVHLKKNSVAVTVGEYVRAGQQLGLAASSGNSSGPHLHFGSYNDYDEFEPFAGACRPGASGWEDQPPMDRTARLIDFAPTYQSPLVNGGLPFDPTRTGQIGLNDSTLYFWAIVENLAANTNWRVRFQRPNGTMGYDSGDYPFGQPYLRGGWFYWNWSIGVFENTVGTWKILLDFNGQRMIEAPIVVRPQRVVGFNRAPAAVTVSFDPPAPHAADAIFCRVNTSLTLDDPDYDVVRYEYVWKVNGQVVRQVTSAGQADAIPAYTASGGDVLQCIVTPNDGNGGFASPAWAQAQVGASPAKVFLTIAAEDRNGQWYAATGQTSQDQFEPLDLCVGRDAGGPSQIGLEFALPAPRGAVIESAWLEMIVSWDYFGNPATEIYGYDVGNAPAFDFGSNVSLADYAPVTAATVPWDLTTPIGEQWYATPDLAAVVQEVVNRGDWNAGNFIGIVIDGSPSIPDCWRCYHNFDSGTPARLVVSYSAACEPCDTNCDGSLNQFDIQPFVESIISHEHPCGACAGDTNGDGSLNQFDIQGFVDCLTQ